MKTIAITIDDGSLEQLDELARRSGESRSRVVRLALRDYLSRAQQAAEDSREREIIRHNRSLLQQQAAALVKEQTRP